MPNLEKDRTHAGSSAEKTRCIVSLEYSPASLHSPLWILPFRNGSLLSYCLSTLRRMSPFPLLVVTPECTSDAVRAHLSTLPVEFMLTASVRTLPSLREAAQRLGLDRVLAVNCGVGAGLLPDSMLQDVSGLHSSEQLDITVAEGLPSPLYAHCYETAALDILCDISQGPNAPDTPTFATNSLRLAMHTLREDGQFKLAYINVPERYGLTECPKFVPFGRADDLRALDSVLPYDGTSDPKSVLANLRKRIIEALESAYKPRPRKYRRRTRLRVLYASNPSAYSGGEDSLITSIRSLGATIEAHALIAIEGVLTERLRSAGVTVHCPGADFAVPTVGNFLSVSDLLDRIRPDLVHANAIVGSPLLAACVQRGVPVIQWMRRVDTVGLDEPLICATRITAVSCYVAAAVSREMIRPEKIRVLYNGLDCEQCSPDRKPLRDLCSEYGIQPEERVILCIARFVPDKRHDVLIGAFARLARTMPGSRLLLVGAAQPDDGGTYERCVAMVNANRLSDRVRFLGFQRDVLDLEQRADVVVLCSEREALARAVLEGMALGRPVIVAKAGGLPELVEDGVTGLHCQPGSPESLHDRLVQVLSDRDLGERLGTEARRTALARFSLPVHASALHAIYREMLS